MKKNLLITLDYPPMRGGIARYLHDLVQYFDERIRVVHAPDKLLYRFFWPHWLKTVLLLMREQDTYQQVLVSHMLPFGTAAYLAQHFTKKSYIIFTHGMDVGLGLRSPWKRFLAHRVLNGAKLIIANTHTLKEELEQHFGVRHVLVVYPSVPARDVSLRKSEPAIQLLTVARLVPRKGHARVLEALKRLRDTYPNITLRYTIIGDGPEYGMLMRLIDESGLQETVRILSHATDSQRDAGYAQADVFIMPTSYALEDREGFGMVYLEAASWGIPSIATRHSGVDEAVLDGETGLLIRENDDRALDDAILRLATDADLRQHLGAAAKKRVETELTPQRQWEKLNAHLW